MALNDSRIQAYTVAAINGMLSSEPGDVEYNARYIAERAKEIVDYCIALEDGEEPTPEEDLFYGTPSERVPAGEFEPESDSDPDSDSAPDDPDPDPTGPPTEEQQEKSCFHCVVKEVLSTTKAEFIPDESGVSTNLQSAWGRPTDD